MDYNKSRVEKYVRRYIKKTYKAFRSDPIDIKSMRLLQRNLEKYLKKNELL